MSREPEQIGRYAVTSELGRGSMGVVHLAHDPLMDRDLAIKTILLPCGLTQEREEEFRARFLREAQAAGRLSHPGIVTIYDFNEKPGSEPPFIAMEYVDGPTLHELICDEGALSPDWALNMTETLADALRVAHHSGVLHRDIKPANILVRESDGVAKIADFGVARVRASEREGSDYTYGSPAYMAPECVRGEPSDERSDLFSLAVIFYEALCGRRPFEGDGYDTIRRAILHDPPTPIRRHAPDLSPAFERFFARALAKAPEQRFEDAGEFCEALQAIRDEHLAFASGAETVITAVPEEVTAWGTGQAPFGGRLRLWVGVAAVALLIVGAFILGRLAQAPAPAETRAPGTAATPPPARTEVAPPPPTASDVTEESTVAAPAESTAPEAAPGVAVPLAKRPAPEPADPPPTPQPTPAPVVRKPAVTTQPAPVEQREAPRTPEPEPTPVRRAAPRTPEPAAEVPPVAPVEKSRLDLRVRSNLRAGTLTLLVDGEGVYFAELSSAATGKMGRVFRKAVGKATQSLEATVDVPAGSHTIEARVFNEAKSRELTERLDVRLEPGRAQGLRIVTGGTLGRRLDLELLGPDDAQ